MANKIDPHISIVTLAVNDLAKAVNFYRDGLGFPYSENSNDNIAFFELKGTWLALYPRDLLAKDINIEAQGQGFTGVTLAHNVRSKDEVDAVMALVEKSGGKIIKPAQDAFWGGYSGYFRDLDEHLWEVAWNPHFNVS